MVPPTSSQSCSRGEGVPTVVVVFIGVVVVLVVFVIVVEVVVEIVMVVVVAVAVAVVTDVVVVATGSVVLVTARVALLGLTPQLTARWAFNVDGVMPYVPNAVHVCVGLMY